MPATANMSALLRSVRLLKFSPSGLLQITATKRNRPPLGRLYSGALGGSRTGFCSRQIRPLSGNVCSRVGPYAVGCVHNYSIASEQRDETNVAVRTKQGLQFDWALTKLDSSVRRTGRITKTLLLRIFHDICRTGYPNSNQALLLLRSCGSLLPEVPPQERTDLAHHVWEKLLELGAQYDVSHYNALLKVYLQNDFKFSPTDFLAKMENANIQPNRVTYQRLITAYCQNGDIEGASTILGFMKSSDLPITEAVFNSLVTGHARAGDIESAKNILTVMQGAGIEPGPETYLSLLTIYAEGGDLDSLKKTLEAAESSDCSLMDKDLMQIIFTLAKAGYQQHIPEMVERFRHERGYIPDAMNLCLSLITHGLEDTAFYILKTFPVLQTDGFNSDVPALGSFFLRHCINRGTPVEKIGSFCKELQQSNLHSEPLTFSLYCALEAKKTGISLQLMKILKEQDFPIRAHYFWPLFAQYMKDHNTAGVMEIVKAMQELDVTLNVETLSNYIIPVFPSTDAAQTALKDVGVSMESKGILSSEIRSLAHDNLAKLYTRLSDPSFPSLELINFRGSTIMAFKRSSDVETMVKITELLFTDERFHKESTSPPEGTSYFLYSLIDSMEMEVQAQEGKLRKYFNQLQTRNIVISPNIYRGIKNLLESYQVPELIKDVKALVDTKEKWWSSDSVASPRAIGYTNTKVLLARLAELKANNKPLNILLKQTLQNLCAEENLQSALELKQEYEDKMTAGSYAMLINMCCRHNNVEEALSLKREMSRKDSSVALDASKYIALITTLSSNGKVDEAVDILKEMKEKEVVLTDANMSTLFHGLNSLVTSGGAPTIKKLQDTIFSIGLAKPSASLCSPLVTAYLDSKDISGALDAVLECQKLYNRLPRIHDIIVGLVEQGDTALLQKAMDFVSQTRGEMTMLYDLFFAFLQTGRYREARKIIETPGLRARPGRLHWFAEKCISANQMEALEQMVDMTAKLFECDRDEMYSYILRICKDTNNWQKAEATWTKMQEENVIPRERTLRLLANILKSNGQEVPFEVPESWYEQDFKPEINFRIESATNYQIEMLALCKKGKVKEAFEIMKKANKSGLKINSATCDHLIRALLAAGSIEDAMVVKNIATSYLPHFKLSDNANNLLIITHTKKGQTKEALQKLKYMLQKDQVPSQLTVIRVVQALANHGDLEGIQEVESLMKGLNTTLNLSSMLFIHNMALAHIKNDNLDSALEMLEAVYTSPDSTSPSMSYLFRKVLEDGNDKALDKLSAMAERLANHFACYRPASDLFIQLLDMDKVEDAKFMLARCNALAEQKDVLISYMSHKAQIPGQIGKIKTLQSLIPDFAEKDILYSYMMKCHAVDKDLPAAKALYELMQKDGLVNDLSLKRLAKLYHDAGEEAPFPEPPESFSFYVEQLKEKAAKAKMTEEK